MTQPWGFCRLNPSQPHTQTIYAHLEWWKGKEIAADGFGGRKWGHTVNTSLSISEILHVCCFYDPVKLGFKPTATIPPLQILLTVILSTIFEKKKDCVFNDAGEKILLLQRRHKLHSDNGHCFIAWCLGAAVNRKGGAASLPAECQLTCPP